MFASEAAWRGGVPGTRPLLSKLGSGLQGWHLRVAAPLGRREQLLAQLPPGSLFGDTESWHTSTSPRGPKNRPRGQEGVRWRVHRQGRQQERRLVRPGSGHLHARSGNDPGLCPCPRTAVTPQRLRHIVHLNCLKWPCWGLTHQPPLSSPQGRLEGREWSKVK